MGKVIPHDLLPKQKPRRHNLKVKVDLYDYAAELFDELSKIGIIQRLKDIPQLGVIKVPQKLMKSRFDYTVLQLYCHGLIRKNIQRNLELSYSNYVKAQEFRDDMHYLPEAKLPTVGDMLQILAITYNLGHFYNTFTASRAVIMVAKDNSDFRSKTVHSSHNPRFQEAAKSLLNAQNYQRLHLLNSLLVLERCNQSKPSVILAQELLFAYLNEDELDEKSKLRIVFKVFRSVRNFSYIAYDLQIANMPLIVDLCNEDDVLVVFRELLSVYNDQLPAKQLIGSIQKMLDDTVYNENSSAICYYQISRKIARTLSKDNNLRFKEYYSDFWLCRESIFNKKHRQSRDYSSDSILKLTFPLVNRELSQKLLIELERINNSRVGYYDRNSGEQTILVSIKKNCHNKAFVAFRVLKTTVKYLRKILSSSNAGTKDNINADKRYLIATKFFLYYFFDQNPVVIDETVDSEVCVLCTRGKKRRISELNRLLSKGGGDVDERHEVEFMIECLSQDDINDTSITIPASILVFEKDSPGKPLCEFDGMVIHPTRREKQILLFEAKNTSGKPSQAKRCLEEKLDKVNLSYSKDAVEICGYDAVHKRSI